MRIKSWTAIYKKNFSALVQYWSWWVHAFYETATVIYVHEEYVGILAIGQNGWNN